MPDIFPFPEYKPDLTPYKTGSSVTISNVFPRADGYGPVKTFVAFSTALAAACRGYFYARNTDGSVTIFAGTSTKLYKMSNTDTSWSDVSRGAGSYTGLPTADQWQFAQFNNFVFATQANEPVQVWDLSSSTAFANLSGSPPQAKYIQVVGRFVVLSGLLNNPYRIHWSGLNATTTWTAGTNFSDYQDIPDGGIVRTVGPVGADSALIMQDSATRRMTYIPGSPVVFQIELVAQDKGIFAPLSVCRAGDRLFWIGNDGFKMAAPGQYPVPIGREKIDNTFFADVDTGNLQLCIAASDPKTTRAYFAYKSISGSAGAFDKVLCYDYALERFTPIALSGEFIATLAKPGITLDALDSISSSIDALTISLDDISSITLASLSCVNSSHVLGYFTGSNLEATLETPEQTLDRRMRVKGFRPVTDAATCYGSVGNRETLQSSVSYSTEQAVNTRGLCPANVSTRMARGKIRIPAGTSWTFASGIEPLFGQEGRK